MSRSKPTVAVFAVDIDGCLGNSKYELKDANAVFRPHHPLITKVAANNERWFAYILGYLQQHRHITTIIIASGSARQDYATDNKNATAMPEQDGRARIRTPFLLQALQAIL